MKRRSCFLLCMAILLLPAVVMPQKKETLADTIFSTRNVPVNEVPPGLIQYVDTVMMQGKAALYIFNKSLHPLGKTEFMDSNKVVRYLSTPLKMNRCTLLYIDSGVHRFHSMYQQNSEPVLFQPGEFFMALLTSRTVWPFPFTFKKEKNGEEYGPVLLHYITGADAAALLTELKKKEVIINR